MHYNLSDLEMFYLNIQISIFFKEFSQFESEITPEFRHPILKSKIIQHKGEMQSSFPQMKQIDKQFLQHFELDISIIESQFLSPLYLQYYEMFSQDDEENLEEEEEVKKSDRLINFLEEIGIYKEFKNLEIADCSETNVKNHENLNIEIKRNRQKFLDYFLHIIQN